MAFCAVCSKDLAGLSEHGRRVHFGRCRNIGEDGDSTDLDLSDTEGDAAAPAAPAAPFNVGNVAEDDGAEDAHEPQVADQFLFQLYDDFAEDLPAVGPTLNPFPTEADAALAEMYIKNFGLPVGTLNDILRITRQGSVTAKTTAELVRWIDELPGMEYKSAETTLPGYPDGVYRVFFRDIPDAVDYMLKKHGAQLLNPTILPTGVEGGLILEEMWQGSEYQDQLKEFRKVASPRDVLLPLVFFSGACNER